MGTTLIRTPEEVRSGRLRRKQAVGSAGPAQYRAAGDVASSHPRSTLLDASSFRKEKPKREEPEVRVPACCRCGAAAQFFSPPRRIALHCDTEDCANKVFYYLQQMSFFFLLKIPAVLILYSFFIFFRPCID